MIKHIAKKCLQNTIKSKQSFAFNLGKAVLIVKLVSNQDQSLNSNAVSYIHTHCKQALTLCCVFCFSFLCGGDTDVSSSIGSSAKKLPF